MLGESCPEMEAMDEYGHPEPKHGRCRYCGSGFHADEEGPGAEYCSPGCYQWDTHDGSRTIDY